MITVYGASDDCIEIEGDIEEEFDYTGADPDVPGNLLAFSDGTVLRITFNGAGIWRITRAAAGGSTLAIDQASEDGEEYSDRATLDGEIRWVVVGNRGVIKNGRGPAVADETRQQDPLDLDGIRPWLNPCGSCDYGLPMSCACPQGDPRIPMAKLFAEVERFRKIVPSGACGPQEGDTRNG